MRGRLSACAAVVNRRHAGRLPIGRSLPGCPTAAYALLALALALGGCGKVEELPPDLFPQTVAGGWRRSEMRDLPPSDSPDPVPRNEVERLRAASYEGPGKLEVRVYQLSSAAMGAELTQRWRPSADTVFFASGRFFVVVKWQAADRKALQDFLRELESRLAPAAKQRQ